MLSCLHQPPPPHPHQRMAGSLIQNSLSNHHTFFARGHGQLGTKLEPRNVQVLFVLLYPDRGTTSAPVSLTTHPQHQMVPQPGPNSMPAGYWSGGGVSSGPSHSSMYSPATPLSTGASSSQQSLPSVHPPPPTSQQLHPRPLQRPKGLYLCNYGLSATTICSYRHKYMIICSPQHKI